MCIDCDDMEIPQGNTGEQGLFGGYSSSWNFDSGLTNTPAVTDFRLNNINPTLVTEIYVNTTNSENDVITAFLASFTNGSQFGQIRIFDIEDSSIYHYYTITASAVAGAVYTFTVTYVSGSGSTALVNNSINVISFSAKGIQGIQGIQGDPGDDQFLLASFTPTPAQIYTLNTVPINIISGVASKLLDVVEGIVTITGGTVAYAGNTILQIIANTAVIAQFELDCLSLAVGNNFSFKMPQVTPNVSTATTGQLATGEPIQLKVKTGNPTAATGDRVVTVRLVYRQI